MGSKHKPKYNIPGDDNRHGLVKDRCAACKQQIMVSANRFKDEKVLCGRKKCKRERNGNTHEKR